MQTSDLWLHVSCSRNDIARGKNKEENSGSLRVTDESKIKRIHFQLSGKSHQESPRAKKGKCGFAFAVTQLPQTNQYSLRSPREATGRTGAIPANWSTLHTPCSSHIMKFQINGHHFHGQLWPLPLVLKQTRISRIAEIGCPSPSKEWRALGPRGRCGKNLKLLCSSWTGQGSREVRKFLECCSGGQDLKLSEWYKLEAE